MPKLTGEQIRDSSAAVDDLARSLFGNGVVANVTTARAAAARLYADGWTRTGVAGRAAKDDPRRAGGA